ncbi:hypothetical protein PM082_013764 [Marasmius tenuissimus]|nr:hypothetical protein PM082_013764 [Marasmius tenuissimus]
MTPADKRATWSGSYGFLADAGSPTMQILKRRGEQRSTSFVPNNEEAQELFGPIRTSGTTRSSHSRLETETKRRINVE